MLQILGPIDEFVKLGIGERFARLKFWFVILLVIGVIAAGYVIVREFSDASAEAPQSEVGGIAPIGVLLSVTDAVVPQEKNRQSSDERFQRQVIGGIYVLLAVVLLASLGVTFTSKDAKAIERAGDIVKTTLGFFIGAATGAI